MSVSLVTMEAVMSRSGDLLSVQTKDRSATSSFGTDRNLQHAVQEGMFDRNPPSGAEASDGKIHFLFNARVMVMAGPDGRPVGYQAIFSAGLL